MAIAFNAATDGGNNGGSTSSLTFSHTTGSGSDRVLFVVVAGDVGGSSNHPTGVTYATVAMTEVDRTTTGNRNLYTYFLLNPTSGANNVVVSAGSNFFLLACAADYTGAAQSGQPDAEAEQVAANTSVTTSITTVADNCWTMLGEQGFNASNPPGAGAGSTRRTFGAAFGQPGLFDSNAALTPAGSHSMTTTRTTSVSISHVMASFSPAGGGAAPTGYLRLPLLGVG